MPGHIMCPYCSAIIRIRSKHIGKPGRCPKCSKTIMIRQPGGSDAEIPSSLIISRKAFEQDDDIFGSDEEVDSSFEDALASASGVFKEPKSASTPRPKSQPVPQPVRTEVSKSQSPRIPTARPGRKNQSVRKIIGLCAGGFVVICVSVWAFSQLGRATSERSSAPPVESINPADDDKSKEQERPAQPREQTAQVDNSSKRVRLAQHLPVSA